MAFGLSTMANWLVIAFVAIVLLVWFYEKVKVIIKPVRDDIDKKKEAVARKPKRLEDKIV